VRKGKFREDLYARLNLWTFQLPALRERKEDIEPNLDFELKRFLDREGENVTFNKEARDRYLAFATGPQAIWTANFRDLSASVTRMATLAPHGRITTDVVDDEVRRLNAFWRLSNNDVATDAILNELLGHDAAARLDRFDAAQLVTVLHTCREHISASSAGRALFAHSRLEKKSSNDADRLVKYLARFDLKFEDTRK
jgi:transcriptional regulatory protein RtcR